MASDFRDVLTKPAKQAPNSSVSSGNKMSFSKRHLTAPKRQDQRLERPKGQAILNVISHFLIDFGFGDEDSAVN
jgi:hypothetical protein